MKTWIKWTVENGVYMTLFFLGEYYRVGFYYIFAGFTVLYFVTALPWLSDEIVEKILTNKVKNSVAYKYPDVDISYDALMSAILLYHANFVLAAMYMVSSLCMVAGIQNYKDEK